MRLHPALEFAIVFPVLFLLITPIIPLVNAQVEITVNPISLPPINEGETTKFSVTVKNIGTEGTISISAGSESYAFKPLTPTFRNMEEDETYTFEFEAYALNVFYDEDTTVKILVQGRGGSDTLTITGKILDVEGYTPPMPPYNEETSIFSTQLFYMFAGIIIGSVTVGTFFIIKTRKRKS